jgi:spore coat polysaccharide biosynthesis protein SpsF
MKTAAIIEARMNSSRLPGKVMKEVNGVPMLGILINRLQKSHYIEDIIVATTDNILDDKIVSFCKKNAINFFRGSENNVLDRVSQTAKKYEVDFIVEVCGDNCFLDPKIVDAQIAIFKNGFPSSCFVSDVSSYEDSFLPVGFDVKIFTAKHLFEINNTANELDREHVSQRFYQPEFKDKYNPTFVKFKDVLNRPELFCVLDYEEDYELMKKCYSELSIENPIFTAEEIIQWMDRNPYYVKKVNEIRE